MIISASCCLTYNWRKIFGNKSELRTLKKRKGSHIWSCDRLWDIRLRLQKSPRLNETDYINTRVFWTVVSVCSGPSVFLSFQCFSCICLSIDIWSIIYFCLYFLSDSDSQSLNRGPHWPAEASSLILLCLLKKSSEWSFKCKLTALFCYFELLQSFLYFLYVFIFYCEGCFWANRDVRQQRSCWEPHPPSVPPSRSL